MMETEIKYYKVMMEHCLEYASDDTLYAWMDLEHAREEGDKEAEKEAQMAWEQGSFEMEIYQKELNDIEKGLKPKIEYASEEYVMGTANAFFEREGLDMRFAPPGRFEDYGIDIYATGYTESDRFFCSQYEIKTLRGKWGDKEKQRTYAGRNRHCRYCFSAATVEELEADRTPKPDWAEDTTTPIAVINASTKWGSFKGSKVHTLLKAHAGLVFVTADRIYIFAPYDLRNAILGYLWINGTHYEDYGNGKKERVWEKKAAIALDRATYIIKADAPEEILRKRDDQQGDSAKISGQRAH